jgi:glycosyltransferase involved in cell wall biosynthesis
VGGLLPDVPVHVVPHFAYPPPPGLARRAAQARARLGVGVDELMLVVAGFATRNKQYDTILKAIAGLPTALRARVRLVVAGALRPDEFDLEALVARQGCAAQTLFAGYLDDAELAGVLAGADLVLNLRFPSFGESSGSVARALGLGALVAVSDTAAYAELPDEVCLKLPARADCGAAIMELIGRLAEQPGDGAGRRAAAAAWAMGDLHPAAMARRYAGILEAAHG